MVWVVSKTTAPVPVEALSWELVDPHPIAPNLRYWQARVGFRTWTLHDKRGFDSLAHAQELEAMGTPPGWYLRGPGQGDDGTWLYAENDEQACKRAAEILSTKRRNQP